MEQKGIPTNKHEDYKYCNVDAILKKEFKHITQEFNTLSPNDVKAFKLEEAINLVIVNGNYSEALSDKIVVNGINIKNLNNFSNDSSSKIGTIAKSSSDAFIALSNAYSDNGVFLEIEKNSVIPMPVQLIFINSATSEALVNARSFIHLNSGAEITISERFVNIGDGKIFANYLSEKLVDDNAKLISYSIQQEGAKNYSVNTNKVKINKYSSYSNTTITLSGQLVRNNHSVELADENSEAHLNGLFYTNDTQLVDNHTLMDHQMPNCESNELYKGLVNGKSTGVFNGKIFVQRDAQKTNAYQSSKNILLSDDATLNTKPELEIYANDVKCSHGTSTGKIDENAMFYLKARGIGDEAARKLLMNAFALEIVDTIEIDSLKAYIENELIQMF